MLRSLTDRRSEVLFTIIWWMVILAQLHFMHSKMHFVCVCVRMAENCLFIGLQRLSKWRATVCFRFDTLPGNDWNVLSAFHIRSNCIHEIMATLIQSFCTHSPTTEYGFRVLIFWRSSLKMYKQKIHKKNLLCSAHFKMTEKKNRVSTRCYSMVI